jgi:putative ABC transport system ATP-binding protein
MILAEFPRSERKQKALEALHSVGLEAWASHRPAELSGGQKQRVAIARAIVMQPRMLLADEPTGNLDTQSGEQILAILEELSRQGITLAVVTHDPAVAKRADRILALRDGEIVQRISAADFTDASVLSIGGTPEAHP